MREGSGGDPHGFFSAQGGEERARNDRRSFLMARATWGVPGFGIRGRVGGLEFYPGPGGETIVRAVPTVRAARTPGQLAGERRIRLVGAAWRDLSLPETEAWIRWADGDGRRAYNLFSALGVKCLQMRPDAPVPRLPPTAKFLGDGIRVGISPLPSGGEGAGGEGSHDARLAFGPRGTDLRKKVGPEDASLDLSETPLTPTPLPRRGEGAGVPGMAFEASGPNSAGVVTELLTQPLARASRKPRAKEYTSRGFVAFAGGSRAVAVPCAVGAWACAFRFVRWDTGQETALVPLGTVVVEGG